MGVSLILVLAFIVMLVLGIRLDIFGLDMLGTIGLAASCFSLGWFAKNPERPRADQTNRTLGLVSDTLQFMRHGLTNESAQEVCKLLLPQTYASSVAIYANGNLMGVSGCDDIWKSGDPVPIPWAPTHFEYGASSVIRSNVTDEEPGAFPTFLKACVSAPLMVQGELIGTLKFYYLRHAEITESQQAMATGFAELLSTQLALHELDEKTELATKMELRALQAQINPHFLFNTINTIASLIRTDPRQARILLREFAVFYRRTLESSQDLITIELELTQTLRYLGFERARFGADKILLSNYIEPGLEQLQVPAFIIQPIVENAVGHAMRPTGEPLHIQIDVKRSGDDVVISVADDGVGMESTERDKAVSKGSSKGAGIALKNVDDRLRSCFGKGSGISIESTLGVGTTVYLKLVGASKDAVGNGVLEEGGNQ
ncbi:MAG: histidine kinase [Coriobacteriales bacterium]